MASIKQRKSKFSVIYWYMDDTGERKQKWDTLETKKEAKARKAFIEFYQQTYGYVLVPLEEQFAHQRDTFQRHGFLVVQFGHIPHTMGILSHLAHVMTGHVG